MEKLLEDILRALGLSAPLIYGLSAYRLFAWLDENASDEAKAALANTMRLGDFDKRQIAVALVEVFDRLYSRPLLTWRAFGRSTCISLALACIFVYEAARHSLVTATDSLPRTAQDAAFFVFVFGVPVVTNVLSDYLSLFFIRRCLLWSGAKPVFALTLGTLVGFFVVLIGALVRVVSVAILPYGALLVMAVSDVIFAMTLSALFVFTWMPLFALGILVARASVPFLWMVGRAKWLLKDGDSHPLKAVGAVAGIVVFAIALGWHAIV